MIDYILWDHLPLLYCSVYVVYISHVAVMLYVYRLKKNTCYAVSTIHAHAHVPQRTKRRQCELCNVILKSLLTLYFQFHIEK